MVYNFQRHYQEITNIFASAIKGDTKDYPPCYPLPILAGESNALMAWVISNKDHNHCYYSRPTEAGSESTPDFSGNYFMFRSDVLYDKVIFSDDQFKDAYRYRISVQRNIAVIPSNQGSSAETSSSTPGISCSQT